MKNNNYVMYHTHTDYSNCVTNVDSVTKPIDYILKAKEFGMKAIAFSEHGSVFDWSKKKELCESNGLKYIHGVEMYVTETLEEKIRDNYHVGLYAKNYDGVLEINKMVSKANNRDDNHFHYTPRITFNELMNSSDNIIITTACIGGVLYKANEELQKEFIEFLKENKHRCFLEVQPHLDEVQAEYNKRLVELSDVHKIQLIAGTDTHALDSRHAKGRKIEQLSRGINFGDEDNWNITMMDYDKLVEEFIHQGSLDIDEIYTAIENTNVLADMVEEFKLDREFKYPKLFDNPEEYIKSRVQLGIQEKKIFMYSNYKEYIERIEYELDTYKYQGMIDYLLLDMTIKDYGRKNEIYTGCSRGSVAGSVVAYLIGIIEIDAIKEGLNFERFANKERVSLADIDSDYPPTKREFMKDFIFNMDSVYCADIITFNTVAIKGAVRDVCRALYTGVVPDELMKQYEDECNHYGKPFDETSRRVKEFKDGKYLEISSYINENVETNEELMRKEYPEVFEYVDIVQGTIVSVGNHPCGTIVSPFPIEGVIGLCTLKDSTRPVSVLSMKQIDSLNFVKLDILGLDNQEIINETCKLAGIERLTPDNVPMDEEVWRSIANDTTGVFQWESESASKYIEKLFSEETIKKIKENVPNFKYIDLFGIGNGAIRPAGASYRDLLSQGIVRDNGHIALNDFLAPTMGYLVYQEQIIEFLNKFCGFTMGEADTVRRGFAKKTGTEQFIPRIKAGFIKTMEIEYNTSEEEAEKLIINFLQIIEDASSYLFSLNHSQAYSYIGYICAYLREKHPLEFFTVALNQFQDNREKTIKIMESLKKKKIKVCQPSYGKSKSSYFCDKNTGVIYKGLKSVKYINEDMANLLYKYSNEHSNEEIDFLNILKDTTINKRAIDTLIKIGYFNNFGTVKKLLKITELWNVTFKKKTYKKSDYNEKQLDFIRRYAGGETEKMFRDVDKVGLIRELTNNIKDELPTQKLIAYQLELMGSSQLHDETVDSKICVVESINTKYTPTLQLYRVADGKVVEVKTSKKMINEKPIVEFDSIYVATCNKKMKRKFNKETEKWAETDEYYFLISYYKM